jgi:hypothetical protein
MDTVHRGGQKDCGDDGRIERDDKLSKGRVEGIKEGRMNEGWSEGMKVGVRELSKE